jgi:hypothetical protein
MATFLKLRMIFIICAGAQIMSSPERSRPKGGPPLASLLFADRAENAELTPLRRLAQARGDFGDIGYALVVCRKQRIVGLSAEIA